MLRSNMGPLSFHITLKSYSTINYQVHICVCEIRGGTNKIVKTTINPSHPLQSRQKGYGKCLCRFLIRWCMHIRNGTLPMMKPVHVHSDVCGSTKFKNGRGTVKSNRKYHLGDHFDCHYRFAIFKLSHWSSLPDQITFFCIYGCLILKWFA